MLKRIREMFKNEKGLTLVELLAVIVILAIVGAIAFVMIGNIIDNSKKDAHVANAMQMIESAKMYEANGNEVDKTTGVTAEKLQNEELLGELIDPWDKKAYTAFNNAKVTRDGKEYTVVLSDNNSKCAITGEKGKESNLIAQGREVCK